MESLAPRIEAFAEGRILCIGDVMLDRFVYGAVDRISPEAPIPVLRQAQERHMLGGAGNVIRNVLSLGSSGGFISVIGDDEAGREVAALLNGNERLSSHLVTEPGRITTEKTRFVSGTQQLLRCDRETDAALDHATQARLLALVEQELPHYQLVLLSDYGKGVLSDTVIRGVIDAAQALNLPVFVDPKRRDVGIYRGATLLSPNLKELALAAHAEALQTDSEIAHAAGRLMAAHRFEYLLATRGAQGMTLFSSATPPQHIPAQAREVFDVSGAGDTAIACLSVAYATGATMEEAAQLANLASGIVVGRLGTASVTRTELKTALHAQPGRVSRSKILAQQAAAERVAEWRAQGLKIGFTNGCFDLLHVGHLSSLQEARAQCDRLIVGINTDESVRRLKGPARPLNSEMDRAMLIAALDVVDAVVLFRDDTPLGLIEALRPDVLMKGADYTKEGVVGGAFVESYGGRVALLPLRDGYSTTALIAKATA